MTTRFAAVAKTLLSLGLLTWALALAGARAAAPPPNKGDQAGKAYLTPREKRMLRWHMKFTARSGDEYLAQLRGLGAILAFPEEDKAGENTTFKVVRDLRPGKAEWKEEDVYKIDRIFWIDDRPDSVKDILAALKVKPKKIPSRFVAFVPEKLEKQLFRMERRYIERTLRKPYAEDRIEETVFRVVAKEKDKATHKVELVSVKMKP